MTDKSTQEIVASMAFAKELAKFFLYMALIFLIMYLPTALDATIEREASLLRKDAAEESRAWREMTDARLSSIEELLGRNSAQIIGEVKSGRIALLDEVRRLNNETIATIATTRVEVRDVSGSLREAIGSTQRNIDKLGQGAEETGRRLDYWTDCTAGGANAACWQVQLTGALGAARATAGEAARTGRAVREAMPDIVASVRDSAKNSSATTQATKQLMTNLSQSFKPLPRWVQIPLQVAVPSATIATPFLLKRATTVVTPVNPQ